MIVCLCSLCVSLAAVVCSLLALLLSSGFCAWPSPIQNISGRFEPGKLVGIMGGSGSGKTSLLNLLANRGGVRQSCKCSGSILFNGRPGDLYGKGFDASATSSAASASNGDASSAVSATAGFSSSMRDASLASAASDISAQQSHNAVLENRIGYVLQQEYLLPHLSVFETLLYAAQLRLSREYTIAQKRARVEEIILELNLKAVRDSLVGDQHTRGISGGEARRVSVAVQMLIDPAVLFLDEVREHCSRQASHTARTGSGVAFVAHSAVVVPCSR